MLCCVILLISFVLNGSVADSSLRVCPCDTVVNSNETVHLHCAAEPGHAIRWYRGTNFNDVIYTGNRVLRRGATDDRYDVQSDDSGNVDLCIRAVKYSDAGVYKCRDMRTNAETDVNIVVVDSMIVNLQQNSPSVRNCSFTFHGQLTPVVKWLDESGQLLDNVTSKSEITDHVVVSTTDDVRSAQCQVTFQPSHCGQLADNKFCPDLHRKLENPTTSTTTVTSTAAVTAEPQRDAMAQLSCVSCDQPINSRVLLVWAASATVLDVILLILLYVTFRQRYKTTSDKNAMQQGTAGPGVYEILKTSCETVAGLTGQNNKSNTEHGCYSQLQFAVYDSINDTPRSDKNQQHTVEQSAQYITLLGEMQTT